MSATAAETGAASGAETAPEAAPGGGGGQCVPGDRPSTVGAQGMLRTLHAEGHRATCDRLPESVHARVTGRVAVEARAAVHRGAQVVEAIRDGIASAAPGREVRAVLVADGGDGTLAAGASVGFRPVPVTVAGPTGSHTLLPLLPT